MGKITFILGGARSGKSRFAMELAKRAGGRVAFIATCVAADKEMQKRIVLHQKSRPAKWPTFEEGDDIASLLRKIDGKFETVIIDCLTLLIANLLHKKLSERIIKTRINQMIKILLGTNMRAIIVSNEVGLGLVPTNKLARDFRDLAGRINQSVASKAKEVFFLVSGIPRKIK